MRFSTLVGHKDTIHIILSKNRILFWQLNQQKDEQQMKSSGFWHHRKRSDVFDVSQCTAEQTGEGTEDEPAFRSERDKEEGAILCNSNTIWVIEIFCKHCGLLCRRLIFEQPACPLLFKCQQVALPASKNHTLFSL
jgi:hypothetical protein